MGSDKKTPKKEKKEKTPKKDKADRDSGEDSDGGEDGVQRPVSAIARPLADLKTTKKILKTVKKGACAGGGVRRSRGTVGGASARARRRVGARGLTSDATSSDAAAKAKQVRRGVKEVVKALKKDTKGFCVIAGDISPIDVITHVPILCEEADVPYVYVHSKEELGAAGMTKRPTSVMLVMRDGAKGSVKMSSEDKKEFEEMYEKIHAKISSMSR